MEARSPRPRSQALGKHSPAAIETILHYTDPQYQDLQAEMFDAVIPLVQTGEDQIGWMRPEIWEGTYKMMLNQGLLAKPLDPQDVYTMRFLESVYAEKP